MKSRPARNADDLRKRAAQCRRISGGAVPFAISEQLDLLAVEYEVLAQRLEGVRHLELATPMTAFRTSPQRAAPAAETAQQRSTSGNTRMRGRSAS